MKTCFSIATAFLAVLAGCTHTTTLYVDRQDTSFAAAAMELEKLTKEDDADILLVNGERVRGRKISVGSDSTSWITADTVYTRKIPNIEIANVSQIDRFRGAVEGGGIGLLIGGAIGGGLYFAHKQSGSFGGHPDLSGLAIPALGIAGAVLGLINGVAKGSHDEFVFKLNKEP